METGKSTQSLSALFYGSVAVPTERKMDARAPLTAVYIQAVPAHPPTQQLFPRAQFPGPPLREPATLHLAMPPVYSKGTLPVLTVHIAGGLQPLRQELGLPTSVPLTPVSPVARTKSAGKHVCPHCSRDCMKPSVLEKHLRCHTGERPYPCITCRVSFKTQSNLYKHKRTQAHARLSSESEHSANSSVGSQDSAFGSSLCSSSLDSQVEEDSGCLEEEVAVFPPTKDAPKTDPEQPSTGDPVQGKINLSSTTQKTEPVQSPGKAKQEAKGNDYETKKQFVTQNRHLPLQRQEATLIFKEWEGTMSRGKPQSHASTDSGFSESADHNMDALPECIAEHHEPSEGVQAPVAALSQNRPDSREGISVREQRSLEEHISKLISENSVLVDDKQLETMRPRKTVLSKQGSIDLPMPYTYKDSFHFDMRNSPAPIDRLHGNQTPVLQSSLQLPGSVRTEQAPLTRSSSLPYSVTLLPPEQSSRSFSHPRDYVTTIRRGSSGPAHQTAFPSKSVDQQVPSHRLLVRQTAVDCNHATEGPFFVHSSTERLPVNSDLSCGVGGGGDTSGEPCDRKRPRKKSQKFTYNKWYTYKGGTFKKLYNTEKGGNSVTPNAKEQSPLRPEQPAVRSAKSLPECHSDGTTTAGSTTSRLTACHPFCLPAHPAHAPGLELNPKPRRVHEACSSPRSPALGHFSSPTLHGTSNKSPGNHSSMDIIVGPAERLASKEKHSDSVSPPQRAHIPSERKKQRTSPSGTEADHNTLNEPQSSVTDVSPTQNTNICQVSLHLEQRIDPHGRGILPQCISASKVQTSVKPPASVSLLSSTKHSFLPKYQLKLPTATEAKSTSSLHTQKMSKRNGDNSCIGVSSSSSYQHCLTSYGNPTSSGHECTLKSHMFSGYPQSTEGSHSTQTGNKCESVVPINHGGIPALAVSQRHCTTITTATATMRSHHTELCSPTVIQASTFKPVMVPDAEHQTRTVLHKQSIMTLTTGKPDCGSPFLSSSATTFTTFSPSHQLNTSRPHHLHTLPSLGQFGLANVVSAGHTVPKPLQMLPFQAGQVDPVQKVFHVQTGDLQICLQIISDEQLALIEPRVKKQAVESEQKLQTQALRSIVPEEGGGEKVTDQSTCDQREMDNLALPPSRDLRCVTLNSEGRGDVSHAQVSGNSEASWSLQPPIHPRSDSNHNKAADNRCCTSSAAQAEALPKAARHDARTAKEEPSVSPGLTAKNLDDVSLQFPGDILQEGSQGSQHTPLRQRAMTCSVEEVTAKLNGRECSPATTQGRDARPLTQRGRAWAWNHAETSHVAPHPGDGVSLFPDINIKICSSSAEVNADPPVCSGGGDGVDLLDPGLGHSEARLQPLRRFDAGRGLGVPLIHSSGDTPAGLARPQPSGPAHGGSSLGGARQKAPEGQGFKSSPRRPHSVGPAPVRTDHEPWETDQPNAEEAEANSRADAGSTAGVPALPLLHHQDGVSGGQAARPSDGTALPHPAPAGGDVNPAQTVDPAPDTAPRQLPPSGETIGRDRQGQVSDLSRGASPGACPQRGCLAGSNPPAVQADALRRDPAEEQNAAPGSTWDAVSAVIRTALTHCSDTPVCCSPRSCPTTQSVSPATKPSPCSALLDSGRGSGSNGSSGGDGSSGIASSCSVASGGGSGCTANVSDGSSSGSGSSCSGASGGCTANVSDGSSSSSGSSCSGASGGCTANVSDGSNSGIGSSCSGASGGGSGCTASVSDGGIGGVSISGGMRAEEGEVVHVWKSWTCAELSGPAGDGGVVGAACCEDPLRGGGGGGYSSNRFQHQHHHQEEEVMAVFSEAQVIEGSTTNSARPLIPNCQGSQEESSSDDDDEGKLIIEL